MVGSAVAMNSAPSNIIGSSSNRGGVVRRPSRLRSVSSAMDEPSAASNPPPSGGCINRLSLVEPSVGCREPGSTKVGTPSTAGGHLPGGGGGRGTGAVNPAADNAVRLQGTEKMCGEGEGTVCDSISSGHVEFDPVVPNTLLPLITFLEPPLQ